MVSVECADVCSSSVMEWSLVDVILPRDNIVCTVQFFLNLRVKETQL
jgi:hypothetical protein